MPGTTTTASSVSTRSSATGAASSRAQVQPAGKKATVDFRFRNGNKVSFEAHAINVAKLLDDVKAYLKSNPGQLDWHKLNIGNIGYRLVEQNRKTSTSATRSPPGTWT